MAAYMHGNLAVDERYGQKNNRREIKKEVTVRKSMISAREKLLYLLTIVICVVVAGIVIFRYAQIYEVNTKIQKIEQDIVRLEAENRTLKLSVRKLQEPKRLIEMSKTLGFIPAVDSNISEVVSKTNQLPLPLEDQNIAFLD